MAIMIRVLEEVVVAGVGMTLSGRRPDRAGQFQGGQMRLRLAATSCRVSASCRAVVASSRSIILTTPFLNLSSVMRSASEAASWAAMAVSYRSTGADRRFVGILTLRVESRRSNCSSLLAAGLQVGLGGGLWRRDGGCRRRCRYWPSRRPSLNGAPVRRGSGRRSRSVAASRSWAAAPSAGPGLSSSAADSMRRAASRSARVSAVTSHGSMPSSRGCGSGKACGAPSADEGRRRGETKDWPRPPWPGPGPRSSRS